VSRGAHLPARFVAWNRGSAAAARRTPARNLANAVLATAALVVTALLVLAGQAVWLVVLAGALVVGHHVWFGVLGARDRRGRPAGGGADGLGR